MKDQVFTLKRQCKRCGETFPVTNPRSYYCPACHTGICTVCGTAFQRTTDFAQFTCSPACARKGATKKPQTIRPCIHCGKPFVLGHLRRKFCSRPCAYAAARIPDDQKRRLNSRSRKWRASVLNRDGHRCARCGNGENVHAHHIKPWRTFAELRLDVSNGVSLCGSCHGETHGRRIGCLPANGGDLTCAVCGAAYHVPGYRLTTSKYCSKTCWSHRATPNATCEHCGKPFHVNASRTRFCSRPCAHAEMVGAKASAWKDGRFSNHHVLPAPRKTFVPSIPAQPLLP